MDASIWLACGLIPTTIVLAACLLADRRSDLSVSRHPGFAITASVIGLAWGFAILAALIGWRIVRGEPWFVAWPDDFWQRGYLPVLMAAALLAPLTGIAWRDSGRRWVIAGLLAMLTATISLPTGERWEDTLAHHRGWGLLLATTCLLGFWSCDRLATRDSDRWFPLVLLASLAGPMFVAATTYSALAEWTMAAIFATLPAVVLAGCGRLRHGVAVGLAYPVVAFATVMTAAGRFYSYEDHPWWSYAAMLLVGPAVVAIDSFLTGRSQWLRVATAAVVAIAVTAIGIAVQLRPTE